jgi:quercetin dioxygenase-like cupin family protein
MPRLRYVIAVLAGGILVAGLLSGTAPATPGTGITTTNLVRATIARRIHLNVRVAQDQHIRIHTDAPVDIVDVKVELEPGGTTGWHSHPGPSFNAVAEGEVTYYKAESSSCAPNRYPAGTTFIDTGQVVHTLRNEGAVPAVLYVTWLVPAGANPIRIDQPSPGNCPF